MSNIVHFSPVRCGSLLSAIARARRDFQPDAMSVTLDNMRRCAEAATCARARLCLRDVRAVQGGNDLPAVVGDGRWR